MTGFRADRPSDTDRPTVRRGDRKPLDALRGRIARGIDRWLGEVGDETSSEQDCLAAQMLWWDPRVLPRTSS